MPVSTHAVLSASGAERWLNCPGSIAISEGIPSTTNVYAEEGTAAHLLAEWCLGDGVDASSKIGKTVMKSEITGEFIVVTKEMAEAVQVYLDHVRETFASMPGATMVVEHKFHLDWIVPGKLGGTNDCNIFQPYGKMRVIDYKHGQGVIVDPVRNPQLMDYALGALGPHNPHMIEEVQIDIVQPRAPGLEPIRSWTTTPEELYHWAIYTLLPGAKAALKPDAVRVPGDWCRFCPALATCPEVRAKNLEAAGLAFSPVEVPEKSQVILPAAAGLSTSKLEQIMEVSGLIEEWASAIASELKRRLEAGEIGTRFKIVMGRSSRKWVDETAAAEALKPHIDPWETSLVSPKGAEDMLKDRNFSKKERETFVAALTEKTAGRSLAPMDDKRDALTIATPFKTIDITAEEVFS